MKENTESSNHLFKVVFIISLVIAISGWFAPLGMPLKFHTMLWWSLPLTGLWLFIVSISILHFRKKGLWLLIGAPPALYWAIWLLINNLPSCYWTHNCS